LSTSNRIRAVTLAALSLALSRDALAFKTEYHESATAVALPFLQEKILLAMQHANHEIDYPFGETKGTDRYHFNDCGFAPSSRQIRALFEQVVADAGANPPTAAAAHFGSLLHIVQDFYAHSNWVDDSVVDSNKGPLIDDVFPADASKRFPTLDPWQIAPGAHVILIGEAQDSPLFTVTRDPKDPRRIVVLKNGDAGTPLRGIMTGAYDGNDKNDGELGGDVPAGCPREVAIGHWDRAGNLSGGLNKDSPARPGPGFANAYVMAVRQTRREWCRLVTALGGGNEKGLPSALKAWVDPKAVAAATDCRASVPPIKMPVAHSYVNLAAPRIKLEGVTSGGRSWMPIGIGGDLRYGPVGLLAALDVVTGIGSPTGTSIGFEAGGLVATPDVNGGWSLDVRYQRLRVVNPAAATDRFAVDVGYDLPIWRWEPIFDHLRFQAGAGYDPTPSPGQPSRWSFGGAVSFAHWVVDYPY